MATKSTPVITGWLKKEADKGLKVGNLIKKPFNDRWFVLDNTDCRLYYYEKQASEVPNGFIDLVKITKIVKTGKSDIEFAIETNDEFDGSKIYTLHAPSAAQMELWMKAINIVMGLAKSKVKPSASTTTKSDQKRTSTNLDATTSQSESSSSSPAPSDSSDTSFGEALKESAKKETQKPAAGADALKPPVSASLPSRVTTSDPAPPKSTGAPAKENFAATGPSNAKGKANGSFLSRQRASAHPSTPSKPAVSPGIASISSTFQPNGDATSPANSWRKSTPQPPNSSTQKPATPSIPSPTLTRSTEVSTTDTASVPAQETSTPPVVSTTTTTTTPNSTPPSSTPKRSPPPAIEKTAASAKRASSEPVVATTTPSTTSTPTPLNSSQGSTPIIVTGSHRSSDADVRSSTEVAVDKSIAETFKIGGLEVVLKSSLSSLAPQTPGTSLLTDADFLQIDTPLIKSMEGEAVASAEASSSTSVDFPSVLKASTGLSRPKPLVPSPLSILEESIRRTLYSSEGEEDQEGEESALSHSLEDPSSSSSSSSKEKAAAKRLETPDEFVAVLKSAKERPDEEVLIALNDWILIGLKGSWAVQHAAAKRNHVHKQAVGGISTGTTTMASLDDEADAAYDPESSYTWHLPGFIAVRWYRHNTWSVMTREVTPGDEVKWDLASVGKSLQALDAVIAVPRQALIYHLYAVVQKLKDKCFHLRAAYEVPLEQKGDELDEAKDPGLSPLIRGQLCTRLAAVLLDGFNDWSVFRKYHIWDFILEATPDRSTPTQTTFEAIQMRTVIDDIHASSSDANIKFRTFVVTALNQRRLFAWMRILLQNKQEVEDYYDEISLMRQLPVMLLNALAPLSDLPFQLSTRLEPAPSKKPGFFDNLLMD